MKSNIVQLFMYNFIKFNWNGFSPSADRGSCDDDEPFDNTASDGDENSQDEEGTVSDSQRKTDFLKRFNPDVKEAAESLKESIEFLLQKKVIWRWHF